MPKKKLECYTKPKKDGGTFTTCVEGQKKKIKFKVKPKKEEPKKKIKFKVKKDDFKRPPPVPTKVKKRPPPVLTKEQQNTPLMDLLYIDTPIAQRFTKKGTFLGLFDKEEDALFDPFFDPEVGELPETPSVPTSTKSVGLPEVKKKRRYRKKKP